MYKSSAFAIIIITLLFIISVAGSQSPATTTGSISVSSIPSGATIYLDGVNTGYTTPWTITGVSAGSHTIRCSLSRFGEGTKSVTVTSGGNAYICITLGNQHSTTTPGAISVISIPLGATIYLDGINTGHTTPWTLTGLSAGPHTVRCSLNEYNNASQTVTVASGQTTGVAMKLGSQGSTTTPGAISVISIPSGATINLDGMNTGYTTPRTLTGVSAGLHTVRCSLSGYSDASQSVTVASGQTASVSVILTSQDSTTTTGSIYVSSIPLGAKIYLDNTDTHYTTPRTLTGVSAGTHTVRCILSGFGEGSQNVTVTSGRTASVSIKFAIQSSTATTGSISVSSIPSGATIFLDGVNTLHTTPWTISGVTAGPHTIQCRMGGYKEASQSVTVGNGEITIVLIQLKPLGSENDYIIGAWRYMADFNDVIDTYRFYSDGTFIHDTYRITQYPPNRQLTGSWESKGGNQYKCRKDIDGDMFTIIYDPTRNIIYDTRYPSHIYSPVV